MFICYKMFLIWHQFKHFCGGDSLCVHFVHKGMKMVSLWLNTVKQTQSFYHCCLVHSQQIVNLNIYLVVA